MALLLSSVNTPTCHAHNMNGQKFILTYVNEMKSLDRSMTNYHDLHVEYIHICVNYDDVLTCYCWLESWETSESSS